MMIPAELQIFLYVTKRVLKVIEDMWSVDREPPCFLYAAKRVLNIIEDVWSVDREPPIGSPLIFVCGATHVKNLNFY
jgi:hypothetical protein